MQLVLTTLALFSLLGINRGRFRSPFVPATLFALFCIIALAPFGDPPPVWAAWVGVSWVYAFVTFFLLGYFEKAIITSMLIIGVASAGLLAGAMAKAVNANAAWFTNVSKSLIGRGWVAFDGVRLHAPRTWHVAGTTPHAVTLERTGGGGQLELHTVQGEPDMPAEQMVGWEVLQGAGPWRARLVHDRFFADDAAWEYAAASVPARFRGMVGVALSKQVGLVGTFDLEGTRAQVTMRRREVERMFVSIAEENDVNCSATLQQAYGVASR